MKLGVNKSLRISPRVALRALAGGILLALILVLALGIPGVHQKGDFPAFFAAGEIVSMGRGHELYSAQLQASFQEPYGHDSYLAFVYPPWVAGLFSLFVPLGFLVAKWLWTGLMIGAGALAAYVIAGRRSEEGTLAVLLFPPLLHATLAGQNTALALLLISLIQSAFRSSSAARAGLLCGLLFYKPHYGLIMSFVGAVRFRDVRFFAALTTVVGLELLLSFWISGDALWRSYPEAIRTFSELDFAQNRFQMISLPAILPELSFFISAGLILLTGVLSRFQPDSVPILLVLAAPHALYYDFALALPAVRVFPAVTQRRLWGVASILTGVFICRKPDFPVELLTLFLLFVAGKVFFAERQKEL